MTSKDLKTLSKNLHETKKLASTDLSAVDRRTLASVSIMKAEATARLKNLETEYIRRVRANTLALVLSGSTERCERFAQLAAEEIDAVVVHAESFLDSIAQKVHASMGSSREFTVTQASIVSGLLEDAKEKAGVRQVPLKWDWVALQSLQDVKVYIREIIRQSFGEAVFHTLLNEEVNNKAIDAMFAGNLLCVILVGIAEGDAVTLSPLFSNVVSVEAGTSETEEVTAEFVLQQLKSVRSKLKSK